MRTLFLLLVLWSAARGAVAQSNSRPDPSDPTAPAPEIQPRSVFADYHSFQEQKSDSWRKLNQEVADNPGMPSMGPMKDTSGETTSGMNQEASATPISMEGHDEMAMAKPQTSPDQPDSPQPVPIAGTGVVQGIDKSNGKIKLTHDPIKALGWPKMTMFFRLKDSALADQVKVGDEVEFFLEKSASGYVISNVQKGAARRDKKQGK